ncbi:hypothetical protein HYH02_003125 [Chlamydomonas schloesseri]|uniref:Uncharacterized protein n=1 Tax=Chlamydomonas schloesseri TaxID=2026947 RepID=A0A835WRH4_9CHLO|nr:hypothetical protein HYH02_003125 [Chlamydomonas schloesseri]|eukprot:KAG2452089.1 hypothetical protein HYH02_003125 [Chlamydomonas schloesseri]
MTTSQGEALLAKYLHDSLRTIQQTVKKAAPGGAPAGGLPRSISTGRADGRRAATEVLLPRGTTRSLAPVAAAAAAMHATRRDLDYTMGRPQAQVVMTQARKHQQASGSPQQHTIPRGPSGGGGSPGLPPRPAPAVIRTASATAAQGHHHRNHNHRPHHNSSPGQGIGAGAAGPTRSEARVPAVAAAPALLTSPGRLGGGAGAGGGAGGGGSDSGAKGAAALRRGGGAPSETGTNASWWRKPVTDASYPLTAITDRYAQSMTQSELVKWNDRVARLEAEINAEKERRKHFEAELKKVQAVTGKSGSGNAAGPAAGGKAGGATVAAAGGASSRGATAGAGGVRAALQYV